MIAEAKNNVNHVIDSKLPIPKSTKNTYQMKLTKEHIESTNPCLEKLSRSYSSYLGSDPQPSNNKQKTISTRTWTAQHSKGKIALLVNKKSNHFFVSLSTNPTIPQSEI